jgi:hypothetical protein
MFEPDPELQNLSMLTSRNGMGWLRAYLGCLVDSELVWDDLQHFAVSQGPYVTFLQNSQDLWFDQMGDGKRVGATAPFDWVAPDGCLCDAARPGWIVYKQGDGRTAIHDWGMEFTAAGVFMQSELLLISREKTAILRYLPKLERSVNFIETRRDQPTIVPGGTGRESAGAKLRRLKKADGTYGQRTSQG